MNDNNSLINYLAVCEYDPNSSSNCSSVLRNYCSIGNNYLFDKSCVTYFNSELNSIVPGINVPSRINYSELTEEQINNLQDNDEYIREVCENSIHKATKESNNCTCILDDIQQDNNYRYLASCNEASPCKNGNISNNYVNSDVRNYKDTECPLCVTNIENVTGDNLYFNIVQNCSRENEKCSTDADCSKTGNASDLAKCVEGTCKFVCTNDSDCANGGKCKEGKCSTIVKTEQKELFDTDTLKYLGIAALAMIFAIMYRTIINGKSK